MFLFILESIGTSELIIVGIVALIFLGPRRLPEIARKIGKITNEFRSTANEFKETWRREVDVEEETKLLDLNVIEAEAVSVPRVSPSTPAGSPPIMDTPTVREADAAEIEDLRRLANINGGSAAVAADDADQPADDVADDAAAEEDETDNKRNWL